MRALAHRDIQNEVLPAPMLESRPADDIVVGIIIVYVLIVAVAVIANQLSSLVPHVRIARGGESRPVAAHGLRECQVGRTEHVAGEQRRAEVVAEHEVHIEAMRNPIGNDRVHFVLKGVQKHRCLRSRDEARDATGLAHVFHIAGKRGYANNLSVRGRHDEAIEEGKRAVEVDPLSPIIHVALGHAYLLASRYDEAISQFQKGIEVEPAFANAHEFLGIAYQRKGKYEAALTEMRRADSLLENWIWKTSLARLYTVMNRRESAAQIVHEFTTRRPPASLVTTAALYAAVGERDRPLALLEQACDRRDPDVNFMVSMPAFDVLRGDPAFRALVRRIGLS